MTLRPPSTHCHGDMRRTRVGWFVLIVVVVVVDIDCCCSLAPSNKAPTVVQLPPSIMTTTTTTKNPTAASIHVAFSHVHLYADQLQELETYKAWEDQLNAFCDDQTQHSDSDLEHRRAVWGRVTSTGTLTSRKDPSDVFVPYNRDVVRQLLTAFHFRITAARYDDDQTRSVLITSCDPQGVQFVVTALTPKPLPRDTTTTTTTTDDAADVLSATPSTTTTNDSAAAAAAASSLSTTDDIFAANNLHRFFHAHGQRPGIAVLGFVTDDLDTIHHNYQQLHPHLVARYVPHQLLEVFAYYKAEKEGGHHQDADPGTVLRFLSSNTLPHMTPIPAVFPAATIAQPAYCDHWVSNVWSRTQFLDTLHDTLGFVPKVDFNAGVVAAGEAQIESTVTGNDPTTTSTTSTSSRSTNNNHYDDDDSMIDLDVVDPRVAALKDQRQVYLPINNARSDVGHVHGFLQQLGQGIQHLASRVENLLEWVQKANDMRRVTGEGFTFLNIPRSYYGILTVADLTASPDGIISTACAHRILHVLKSQGHLSSDNAVDLETTRDDVGLVLDSQLEESDLHEFQRHRATVLDIIASSRYKNLYSLLRDHVSEESYLGIVRNQILVDIQGEDLLYQIFTANILQRRPTDEAPFLEFIQRVCSECVDGHGCRPKVRPGCGGFGIRNFLTLFLSIEVSKAMQGVVDAKACGDKEQEAYSQKMVDYFTDQLNESNPILTEISDAMTDEGYCKEQMSIALAAQDMKAVTDWKAKMDAAADRKGQGNQKLMGCSARYNNLMKALRESRGSTSNA